MKNEIPDNEYAGKLVSMMMGMTGMASPENPVDEMPKEEKPSPEQLPEGLRKAVDAGDMEKVVEILRREHEKRASAAGQTPDPQSQEAPPGLSAAEKKLLDDLVRIAADNNVPLDWIISRALKVYILDYEKTGRL
jgi:hypothetical protein